MSERLHYRNRRDSFAGRSGGPDRRETTVSEKRDMNADSKSMVMNSALYREFLAEREEILKHKWIESEKAGYDIGFERALLDWIVKHRSNWRKARRQSPA